MRLTRIVSSVYMLMNAAVGKVAHPLNLGGAKTEAFLIVLDGRRIKT